MIKKSKFEVWAKEPEDWSWKAWISGQSLDPLKRILDKTWRKDVELQMYHGVEVMQLKHLVEMREICQTLGWWTYYCPNNYSISIIHHYEPFTSIYKYCKHQLQMPTLISLANAREAKLSIASFINGLESISMFVNSETLKFR